MSLGHCAQNFVGETNKFVDSAKDSPVEILSFKLDFSLPSLFLHCHFSILALFLWISGERNQCLSGVPLLLSVQTQCMSIYH
jgi:hypothetical protein